MITKSILIFLLLYLQLHPPRIPIIHNCTHGTHIMMPSESPILWPYSHTHTLVKSLFVLLPIPNMVSVSHFTFGNTKKTTWRLQLCKIKNVVVSGERLVARHKLLNLQFVKVVARLQSQFYFVFLASQIHFTEEVKIELKMYSSC